MHSQWFAPDQEHIEFRLHTSVVELFKYTPRVVEASLGVYADPAISRPSIKGKQSGVRPTDNHSLGLCTSEVRVFLHDSLDLLLHCYPFLV